jgi:fatty acid desaturase
MVPDMLKNSRTTTTNWPLRRLAWNMPYHAEHHAYPALPFHALPAAHRALAPRIAVQAPGYIAVHRDIIGAYRRPEPGGAT